MSDEIEQLRETVESLESRVRRLEQLLDEHDESPSPEERSTADRRDQSVLAALRERGSEPSPRQLVKLYKTQTDIINEDTAIKRAKQLRKTEAYTEAVEYDN